MSCNKDKKETLYDFASAVKSRYNGNLARTMENVDREFSDKCLKNNYIRFVSDMISDSYRFEHHSNKILTADQWVDVITSNSSGSEEIQLIIGLAASLLSPYSRLRDDIKGAIVEFVSNINDIKDRHNVNPKDHRIEINHIFDDGNERTVC